ncbi:hypothetical protein JW872_03190 [Candidatus Babeliales bacterium]|nr:hypothetical protein [Candidatus Babeliales bacterium]
MNRFIGLSLMIFSILFIPSYSSAMEKQVRYPRVNRDIPAMHPELSDYPDQEAQSRMLPHENDLWCDAIELRWREFDTAFANCEKHREDEFRERFARMILRCASLCLLHGDSFVQHLFARSVFYQCGAMECGIPKSAFGYLGKVIFKLKEPYACAWTGKEARTKMTKALQRVVARYPECFQQASCELQGRVGPEKILSLHEIRTMFGIESCRNVTDGDTRL